jgi:AbrB family looped-hinge helix DNA binding protein
MTKVVAITSQGQIAIPKRMRELLGISGQTQAVVEIVNNSVVITPTSDFWMLEGSLRSSTTLSDVELKSARKAFANSWTQKQ